MFIFYQINKFINFLISKWNNNKHNSKKQVLHNYKSFIGYVNWYEYTDSDDEIY